MAKRKTYRSVPKGRWSRKYKNDLPDKVKGKDVFLYVEPGGYKLPGDDRTHPLSKRHLPVRDHAGAVSVSHVRAALGRLGQARTHIPAAARKVAQDKARKMLAREHVLREVDVELLRGALHPRRRAA